jgi:hypothetical protein
MDEGSKIVKFIIKYESAWCNFLKIFNPYRDPFPISLSRNIPDFDGQAFHKYKEYNFVYDKLWVMQSQNLICGKLQDLNQSKKTRSISKTNQFLDPKTLDYPIFIKPRWGHKSASSKNCYKINTYHELIPFLKNKDLEMMWSEFIDETEGMTDYIMLNGQILFQITYKYSEIQNGFTDEWKYISPNNKPSSIITNWVLQHLKSFTGAVNIQYRGDKIIEASLRLARGGAYILSANNTDLIRNINNVMDNHIWDHTLNNKLEFTPYYSFKCFTRAPIIYILPHCVLDLIIKITKGKPFYEYYFEPVGKEGMVFFQFLHEDFSAGSHLKTCFEFYFTLLQYIILIAILTIITLYILKKKNKISRILIILLIILFITRFINPIGTQYNLWKAQRQQFF